MASAFWPGLLFLQYAPDLPPNPWLQKYVVLHQVGWWACSSSFHIGVILLFSLLADPAPPEWPELLRFVTSALRFFIYTCRFLISVCSAILLASLV